MTEIIESKKDHLYTLEVIGEVDASSSILLDNAFLKAIEDSKTIIIDLSRLTYISSAGLGVFISYIEELKTKSIKLALYGLAEKVDQVFKILGLHELIKIFNTEEEALAYLNGE